MSTRRPRTTPPAAAPQSKPPADRPKMPAGPGRPKKPTAPRTEAQAALAEALTVAEAQRDAAAATQGNEDTVAAELALLRAELSVASAWASYLRAQGAHTHALKYSEQQTRIAGRIAALRELLATDRLAELLARARREDALGKGKGQKGKSAR